MKRFALYCSGGAKRITDFYNANSIDEYSPVFILYDGGKSEVLIRLEELCKNKCELYLFKANYEKESKKEVTLKFNDNLLRLLNNFEIDYLFCFGDKIINSKIVNLYKNRIINFHPSILPSFPGLNAIDQALNSSTQIIGNTAHFIDIGIDTGPIILQTAIARCNVINYESVLSLQINMLLKIWNWIIEDRIKVNSENIVIIKTEVNKCIETILYSN
jgi:phosphoribosylglycinamide formyltransferase-1